MTKALEDVIYHSHAIRSASQTVRQMIEDWKKPVLVDESVLPLCEEEIEATRRYLSHGGDVPWSSDHVARLVKTIDLARAEKQE